MWFYIALLFYALGATNTSRAAREMYVTAFVSHCTGSSQAFCGLSCPLSICGRIIGMLNEHESVVAVDDIEERDITIMKGSVGTIVHVNRFIPGYMVEFKDGVVVSVWPHEVMRVWLDEIEMRPKKDA